jgi:hypothetical protein
MADIDTQVLPLLPLTTGVVLPGMVVTLTIESDEARAAVEASAARAKCFSSRVWARPMPGSGRWARSRTSASSEAARPRS